MSISRVLGRYRSPGRTEEIAMHPTISYHMARAGIADLRRRAQRETLARAARRARRSSERRPARSPNPARPHHSR